MIDIQWYQGAIKPAIVLLVYSHLFVRQTSQPHISRPVLRAVNNWTDRPMYVIFFDNLRITFKYNNICLLIDIK